MKRTYSDSAKLPRFRCTIDDLAALAEELGAHFPEGETSTRFCFTLKNESFDLDDLSEIAEVPSPPASLYDYTLSLGQWLATPPYHCRLSVTGGLPWSGTADVSVSGDDRAWVAGALAICADFGRRHRRWFWPLRPWMAWATFNIVLWIPAVVSRFWPDRLTVSFLVAWSATLVTVLLIAGPVWGLLFPAGELTLRERKGWLRSHQTEIATVAAVVSALAALIALLVAL